MAVIDWDQFQTPVPFSRFCCANQYTLLSSHVDAICSIQHDCHDSYIICKENTQGYVFTFSITKWNYFSGIASLYISLLYLYSQLYITNTVGYKIFAYEQLIGHIGSIPDCHDFPNHLYTLKKEGQITLYAGTYSLDYAAKTEDMEGAALCFYWNECFSQKGW